MMFKKYHIMVFKDRTGQCSTFRVNGLTCSFLVLLGAALLVSNLILWKYFADHAALKRQLAEAEQTVQEQNIQLVSLSNKVSSLSSDLTRVVDLDDKLRIMLNLEPGDVRMTSALGGAETDTFAEGYLSLHRQDLLARKMHSFIDQLNTEARLEEIRQQELLQAIRNNQEVLAATPSIWPVRGWISSSFGYRKSPFTGRREFHKGLDIAGPTGTPVYAPAKGTVLFLGKEGGYGKMLVLDHGNGLVTRYGHLNDSSLKISQVVQRGEIIATMGNSGRSTGPHLHYEVRVDGVPVNPERYILN